LESRKNKKGCTDKKENLIFLLQSALVLSEFSSEYSIFGMKMEKLCLVKTPRGIVNAASSALWPNNVVPYVLDAAFTSTDRAVIAAVSIWKLCQ
jgi:hypothetical protein